MAVCAHFGEEERHNDSDDADKNASHDDEHPSVVTTLLYFYKQETDEFLYSYFVFEFRFWKQQETMKSKNKKRKFV